MVLTRVQTTETWRCSAGESTPKLDMGSCRGPKSIRPLRIWDRMLLISIGFTGRKSQKIKRGNRLRIAIGLGICYVRITMGGAGFSFSLIQCRSEILF